MGRAEGVDDRAAELADLDPPRLVEDRHGRDERSLGMRPERPGRPPAAASGSAARFALAQPSAGDQTGDEVGGQAAGEPELLAQLRAGDARPRVDGGEHLAGPGAWISDDGHIIFL